MSDSKPKPPPIDQQQAMTQVIPGALQPTSMLIETPIDLPTPPTDLADGSGRPESPMLTDVPIDLPVPVPDPEPDTGRPPADAGKDEWAAWAISRGVPSYEAWAMTIPDLKKLES